MIFLKRKILSFVLLFVIAFLGSVSDTLAYQPNTLFVPSGRKVPISAFQACTTSPCNLTFQVRADLAQYIQSNSGTVKIDFLPAAGGSISALTPTTSNYTTGVFTRTNAQAGRYVATTTLLTNDAIATHWKQSLNAGKGGRQLGASDGLNLADCNLDTVTFTGQGIINYFNAAGTYYYNTNAAALFGPNVLVPDFEKYAGEDYSVLKLNDNFLICYSTVALEFLGWPIVNKSHSTSNLRSNLPAFQVVHDYPITISSGKGSLATYILPPNWTSNPTTRYPLFFNGFYDLNFLYTQEGFNQHIMITNLINGGYGRTIGILWNNGGAAHAGLGGGTRQMHRSAYDNAWLALSKANSDLGGDWSKVVTWGESRGGTTALAVAGNPYHSDYTVRYAIAFSPGVKPGEHSTLAGPTYPGTIMVNPGDTGYQLAWQDGWTEPGTNLTGWQVLLKNYTGTTDQALADEASVWSTTQVTNLKNKGVKVIMSIGTHDSFMPLSLNTAYVEKLRANNVPVRYEIGYRRGHPAVFNKQDLAQQYMINVLQNNYTMNDSTTFYIPNAQGGTDPLPDTNFTAVLEAPKRVFLNKQLKYVVVADAGTQWRVKAFNNTTSLEEITFSSSGTIAATPAGMQSAVTTITTPANTPVATYHWTLEYMPVGGSWQQATIVSQAGFSQADFTVEATQPNIGGEDMANSLTGGGLIGWGLSAK